MKRGDPLSPKELSVATMLAAGKTRVQMALALEVTQSTVNTHICRASKKLGALTVPQLAAKVVALGLTEIKVISQKDRRFRLDQLEELRNRYHVEVVTEDDS